MLGVKGIWEAHGPLRENSRGKLQSVVRNSKAEIPGLSPTILAIRWGLDANLTESGGRAPTCKTAPRRRNFISPRLRRAHVNSDRPCKSFAGVASLLESLRNMRAIGQPEAKSVYGHKFRLPSIGADEGTRLGRCVVLR